MLERVMRWLAKRPAYRIISHPTAHNACVVEKRGGYPFAPWEPVKEFYTPARMNESCVTEATKYIKAETKPLLPTTVWVEFNKKGEIVDV